MFLYEPIWICGKDFGKTLHRVCADCEEQAARIERLREDKERRDRREENIRAQIPPDLLATNTRHPEFDASLWQAVSGWQPGADFWLALVGGAGKCKTRCMALLAARQIRAGVRVTWTTSNRLKDASADRNHRERAVSAMGREHLEECAHAGWLFIDDLGKNEWTPAFESQFFQIIDRRKNHRLPVVFSSNAHPTELSQVISPLNAAPIIGRLLDRTTLIDLF